jgi:hypothetical protein
MSASSAPPVPEKLDQFLSLDWLSAALGIRFPGIEVTDVKHGEIDQRVSTNIPFHIECAGGLPAGLSADLWGKGYFGEGAELYRSAGEPEAFFYRDVAESTGIRTLRSVYADVDPATRHGVVITEDVLGQGATFLNALSRYTPDQAAESLTQLATLHASSWERPQCRDAEWLASRLSAYLERRGIEDILFNFDGPIGAGAPEQVRDAARLREAYRRLANDVVAVSPWSLIHGDPHIGNVYLDGDNRPSFLDWQLVQRGPWYLDVGYHLSSALSVEDRRRNERDLVAHYLDRLAAGGVELSQQDVWPGLRRGMVHGFYLWAITRKVKTAITTELLTRLGAAVADHDAYAELGI